MPPAIHNRMTESAFVFAFLLLQELRAAVRGAPAASAASVAPLVVFRKSLLFQYLFIRFELFAWLIDDLKFGQ